MFVTVRLRAALVGCFLAACSSPAPTQEADPTFSNVRSEVLLSSCALATSCHRGGTALGGLQLDGDAMVVRGRLVGQVSAVNAGQTLVVPGDVDKSYLYRKLTGRFADLACATTADPAGMAATACGCRIACRLCRTPSYSWCTTGSPSARRTTETNVDSDRGYM